MNARSALDDQSNGPRIPWQVADEIRYVLKCHAKAKAHLKAMMETHDGELALEEYVQARLQISFADEACRKAGSMLKAGVVTGLAQADPAAEVLASVAGMRESADQVVVVDSLAAAKEFAGRRLTPQELRSLHRIADHSVDPEPELEEQLTLEEIH